MEEVSDVLTYDEGDDCYIDIWYGRDIWYTESTDLYNHKWW